MRYFLALFFAIALLPFMGKAQQDKRFYLDEICVSWNKTHVKDENTEDQQGYGVSLKHTLHPNSMVNLLFGLEYNHTNMFKKYLVESPYKHSTNITYIFDYLTIPLSARLNYGNRFKVFVEAGIYAELIMNGERHGVMHVNAPGQTLSKNYIFHDNIGFSIYNAGPSMGLGCRIPALKHEIVLKGEYKYGIKNLSYSQHQLYNRYAQLSIGFKI